MFPQQSQSTRPLPPSQQVSLGEGMKHLPKQQEKEVQESCGEADSQESEGDQRAVLCRLHLRCSPTAMVLAVGLCQCLCELDHVCTPARCNVGVTPPLHCLLKSCVHHSYHFSFLLREEFKPVPLASRQDESS